MPENCFPYTPLADPPASTSAPKQIVVIDSNGDMKVIPIPSGRALLYFDGANIYWANGTPSKSIKLPDLWKTLIPSPCEGIAFSQNGFLKLLTNEDATKKIIKLANGTAYLEPEQTGLLLPVSGTGIAYRPPTPADAPAQWFASPGMFFLDDSSNLVSIPLGVDASVMMIVDGVPVFQPPTPAIATGSSLANVSSVNADYLTASSVNVKIPSYQLSDGTNTITVTNVNVTVNFSNPNGLLGLDTGAEQANLWYYIYITSDETDVSAIISADANAPDLTGTGHTFYAFATIFRNTGGNIVPFIQRGRKFTTREQLWGNNLTSTTSLDVISSGTNLNTLIPPNVKYARGMAGGSSTETTLHKLLMAADLQGLGMLFVPTSTGVGAFGINMPYNWAQDNGPWELPVVNPAAPSFYWKTEAASVRRRISIMGYDI